MKTLAAILLNLLLFVSAACGATTVSMHPGPFLTTRPTPDVATSSTSMPTFAGLSTDTNLQPDDIVFTPGGYAYRANVHGAGVANPWPDVETAAVQLANINIRYRQYIETTAGETRNNLVFVNLAGGHFEQNKLNVSIINQPANLSISRESAVGLMGQLAALLVINISAGAAPGKYVFDIGIDIDGRDYGTIPCTVEIV